MVRCFRFMMAGTAIVAGLDYTDHTHSKYDDTKLSGEQLQVLHKKLDADRDGKVDVDELVLQFKKTLRAVSKQNAHEHISSHDEDHDRHLTLEEHIARLANETRVKELGMDLATAGKLDDNGDGKLSWYEFFHIETPKNGDETPPNWKIRDGTAVEGEHIENVAPEFQANFDKLDTDGDGYISTEELVPDTIRVESEKYKAADKNGNGVLDHSEVAALLHPETDDDVLAVVVQHELARLDADSDGKVSKTEFFMLADENEGVLEDEEASWSELDTNADGFLDASELTHWESGHFHATDAFREALAIADSDKDGKVTAQELGAAANALTSTFAMNYFAHWHDHHEL